MNGNRAWAHLTPLQTLLSNLPRVFFREIAAWLIYSCTNFFSSTPHAHFDGHIPAPQGPSPQRERMEWLWVNAECSFSFVLKNTPWHTALHPAYKCTITRGRLLGTTLSFSAWREWCRLKCIFMDGEGFQSTQYVRDHDGVNLFKCKPVQFNYQSIIKFAATTPVLTTAVHTGQWHSRSGNWQTKSI